MIGLHLGGWFEEYALEFFLSHSWSFTLEWAPRLG